MCAFTLELKLHISVRFLSLLCHWCHLFVYEILFVSIIFIKLTISAKQWANLHHCVCHLGTACDKGPKIPSPCLLNHYNDVIMGAIASQITNLAIVYSMDDSRRRSKKTSKFRVNVLCAGNSPVSGEFPAQRASNTENVSILWRHHVNPDVLV